MGHAGREGPDRFQFLRPHQPFFQPLLLRDVDDITVKTRDLSAQVPLRIQ